MTQTHAPDHATRSAICPHHWIIDTPNGALSGGRCKRCGAVREFRNSSEDLVWDSDSFSLNGSRYRGRRAPRNLS